MIKVAAAFLIHNRKVFIARRAGSQPLAGKWEFPGGKVETGESVEACLARELAEEFGIKVAVGAFAAEAIHRREVGTFHILAHRTTWLSGDIIPVDHDQWAWAEPEALLGYDLLPADIELARHLIEKGFGES
jgi:8-oxo-dGTP diphosphatase